MEVEELNRKRKRDKANLDVDSKSLKKRLELVCDNSDMVPQGAILEEAWKPLERTPHRGLYDSHSGIIPT